MKKEEKDVLKEAVNEIHTQYGDGSLFTGMDNTKIVPCQAISTRCISLDIALGIGGMPRGRVVEIFGPESSGKTTLGATVVAQAQSEGDLAAYIDVENALDPVYLKNGIGVDLKRMYLSQPDSGEQAMDIVYRLVKTNKVGVIVVDSVAALVTQAEIDGEVGDHFIGAQARLMSQSLRKLSGIVAKTKTCLIFINQIREKIMGMPGVNPETTPGGRALKFYASVRVDIRRTGSIQTTTNASADKVGNETLIKIVKNKVAVPFKTANFVIMFGKGISSEMSVIDTGVKMGIIEKSGSWFSYKGNKLGQGRIEAANWFKTDEETKKVRQEIEKKIWELNAFMSSDKVIEEGVDIGQQDSPELAEAKV